MFRLAIIFAAIALALGSGAFWALTIPHEVPASELAARTPNLDNGRTMFFATGCASCHATDQDDPTRLGGGVELKTPFGMFFPPNISPDTNDGIGRWSEAQFVTAMLKGTSPDGRHYYPAFPYASYQHMSLDDVRDLFAFLKILPSVQGDVRKHDLPIRFRFRRAIGVWKFLFLDGAPFKPDPAKSAEWNRGAYLVNGPGHCAECHSPRNSMGGIIQSQNLTGAPDPKGEGWIPNITQYGLKDWSVQDIAEMLETGDTLDDSVGGSMLAVVRNTSKLSLQDRKAMAEYLKSLPSIEGALKPPKK